MLLARTRLRTHSCQLHEGGMKPAKFLMPPVVVVSAALGMPASAQEAPAEQTEASGAIERSAAPDPEQLRSELEQLKRINLQVMHRIQLIESRLASSASPAGREPAQGAGAPAREGQVAQGGQGSQAAPAPPAARAPSLLLLVLF